LTAEEKARFGKQEHPHWLEVLGFQRFTQQSPHPAKRSTPAAAQTVRADLKRDYSEPCREKRQAKDLTL
jgi:hypothetical protein